MRKGSKTAAGDIAASTAHVGMPSRVSGYRGRKTGAAGPPEAASAHVGFPGAVSNYRGTKKAAADPQAATPHVGLPKALNQRVKSDMKQTSAAPSRHRMAGSHEGMYVTEHHRGRKG